MPYFPEKKHTGIFFRCEFKFSFYCIHKTRAGERDPEKLKNKKAATKNPNFLSNFGLALKKFLGVFR
jgi:hypothetical protein